MWRNNFECPGKWSIKTTRFIFNSEHVILNLNNVYQLYGNTSIFTRVRAHVDGETKPIHKPFSTMLVNAANIGKFWSIAN